MAGVSDFFVDLVHYLPYLGVADLHLILCAVYHTSDSQSTGVRREAVSLTPRWSQRRLPLEFMDGLSYTTIIEIAEPLARRRGSALDR